MARSEIANIHFYKNDQANFVRSKRARRIRITLLPFKGIRVTIPNGIAKYEAKKFLESKQDWVSKKLVLIREQENEIIKAQKSRTEFDEEQAREHLYDRLLSLSKSNNLKFNRVTFRKQKTRWGSCSSANNLSINLKLYKLPQELQDYVLMHELVHIKIKNHSKQFWRELERLLPTARKLDKELKKYQIMAL